MKMINKYHIIAGMLAIAGVVGTFLFWFYYLNPSQHCLEMYQQIGSRYKADSECCELCYEQGENYSKWDYVAEECFCGKEKMEEIKNRVVYVNLTEFRESQPYGVIGRMVSNRIKQIKEFIGNRQK